jgi:hypothetical protein
MRRQAEIRVHYKVVILEKLRCDAVFVVVKLVDQQYIGADPLDDLGRRRRWSRRPAL